MDCLFCILWKEKQPKEQVDERKAEGKNLKDAKVSSTFEVQLLLLINRIGTKVVVLFACHGLP